MELSSSSSFLSLPTTLLRYHRYPIPPSSLLLPPPSLSAPKSHTFLSKLGSRCRNVHALASEDTSAFTVAVVDKIEEEKPQLGEKENGKEEEVVAVEEDGEESESGAFLNKLGLKLDFDDSYSILIYGTGALVALWLSSAVVGAIDSIPVFPKVMEAVGLGYTLWFSYRYLIFKQNRNELLAKIEELKDQIIGDN